jgi:SAM-dependent methyltransferase
MDWHARYLQQAKWTRDLRAYLFDKAGLSNARRVLEVGCGTGAILRDLHTSASLHGLDLDPAALAQCRIHAPNATLTCGDGHFLPYPDQTFDIVYCHFFLLWVGDPLQAVREMKRVTSKNGHILALAEPDYFARVDKPDELKILGEWQRDVVEKTGSGSRLRVASRGDILSGGDQHPRNGDNSRRRERSVCRGTGNGMGGARSRFGGIRPRRGNPENEITGSASLGTRRARFTRADVFCVGANVG